METKIPNKLEETEFFKEHGNLVEFFDNCCREHKGKTAFESFGVELTFVLSTTVKKELYKISML